MKLRNYLLCVILLSFCSLQAQEKEEAIQHKNYQFNTPVKIESADMKDDDLAFQGRDTFIYSMQGQRFRVLLIDEDYAYIRFFTYKEEDSDAQKKYVKDSSEKFFRVNRKIFENTTDKIYPIYAGESYGVVTIPFKIRLGDNDFETNANVGLNLGLRYRFNRKLKDRWIIQPNIGIGLSDIPLNEENSNVEKAENRTALSLSCGLMLNISSNVNIGLFYGIDRLNKANQSVQWKYQNKGWLGIGINIGFASNNSKDKDIKNVKSNE